jgi:hypothetical protein
MDLEKGEARFVPAPGKTIHPDRVAGVVKDAGFQLLLLELRVRGEFLPQSSGRGNLRIPSTGQILQLGPGTKNPAAWKELRKGSIQVQGPWVEGKLLVEQILNPSGS